MKRESLLCGLTVDYCFGFYQEQSAQNSFSACACQMRRNAVSFSPFWYEESSLASFVTQATKFL